MSVKDLREITGMPVGMCASAWKESEQDMDKALQILKSKGATRAGKLQDRTTSAGYFGMYRHFDGRKVAVVGLRCETDFVSLMPSFRDLANELAMHLAANSETIDEDAFLAEELVSREGAIIRDVISDLSAKTGEKIKLGSRITMNI